MKQKSFEFHPASQPFPLLGGEEYERLKDHIAKHGQLVPIILLDGKILDGRNRYRVCLEIGAEPVTTSFTLDGSTAEDIAEGLNLVRRHLDAKARAHVAVELRKRGESQRSIAAKLGVCQATINNDLAKAGEQKCSPAVTGRDGKQYPASKPAKPAQRPKLPKVGPPCVGMQFARIAIMNLEEIREDDAERAEALATVKGWIKAHE